nr:hypothetical protein B0A51_13316 [Rachicladosporium sp. CCFEE 5018]
MEPPFHFGTAESYTSSSNSRFPLKTRAASANTMSTAPIIDITNIYEENFEELKARLNNVPDTKRRAMKLKPGRQEAEGTRSALIPEHNQHWFLQGTPKRGLANREAAGEATAV